MEIFIQCPNTACNEKIPAKYKQTLKEDKCPACGAVLGLNGEEAQAILLAKVVDNMGWGISPQEIQRLLDLYYKKELEIPLPTIILEENIGQLALRKAINSEKIVPNSNIVKHNIITNIEEPVYVDRPKLTDEQQKLAENNSAKIDNELTNKQLIKIEDVIEGEETHEGFEFMGGLRTSKVLSSSDIKNALSVAKPTATIKKEGVQSTNGLASTVALAPEGFKYGE